MLHFVYVQLVQLVAGQEHYFNCLFTVYFFFFFFLGHGGVAGSIASLNTV